jgi:hypothetical protein
MTNSAPPAWADAWLRWLLPARDRETISGDLMEEYRVSVRPKRSRFAADVWYVGQVIRFAWRVGLWAFFLSALYVARMSYDWFVPITNFAPRAEVTTLTTISTLLVIGASSTLRTRSLAAGVVHTASALAISAVLSTFALAVIHSVWRGPELDLAIANSGGFWEAFAMPSLIVVPGTIVGAVGATIAMLRQGSTRSTD